VYEHASTVVVSEAMNIANALIIDYLRVFRQQQPRKSGLELRVRTGR
jgi:hypothetical protein